MINVNQYLAHLGIEEHPPLSAAGLVKLQKAHLLRVPFENLSIYYGQPISLSLNQLYTKVVEQGRGGFCYELNTLYQALLARLGFEAQLIAGRVYSNQQETYGPDFDHMAVLVWLPNGGYISDVGFGAFPLDPVPFTVEQLHHLPGGIYRINRFDSAYYRLSKMSKGEVYPQYLFDSQPRQVTDFAEMCHYHQSSPDSSFTQKPFISQPTETGRLTISGNHYHRWNADGTVTKTPLNESFEQAVKQEFGMKLPLA